MNIATVMDELGTATGTIAGLRQFPYWASKVTPPAAVVSWPEIDYDNTYARGSDRLTVPLTVVVGNVNARASRDQLAKYMAGAGASSVKQAVEAHTTTAWDVARVVSASVATFTIAGNEYLGAEFSIDVVGSGS